MSGTKQGDGPLGWMLRTAQEEAEAARHGYFGVEHLLVVLARGRSGFVERVLAERGVTYQRARDALGLVVGSGRGDGPAWDATTLLGTLGIDLEEVRRRVQARFGPNAIGELCRPSGVEPAAAGPVVRAADESAVQAGRAQRGWHFWDRNKTPPQLEERLLLGALDVDSTRLRRGSG